MRIHLTRPSPAMVVASLALFIALGSAGYAANGGSFILGQSNSATSATSLTSNNPGRTLKLTQQSTASGATALGLNVPSGKPPLTVNSDVRVVNLNADTVDGIDSASFLRKGIAQSMNASAAGGVVDVTNTGTTNGMQGKSGATGASGVYGEHSGAGFGIAGRATSNLGVAVLGDASGGGLAGQFNGEVEINGPLSCGGCVSTGNLSASAKAPDADKLDGVDSSGFLGASAKAADSNLLDGVDSTGFVQGTGRAGGRLADILPGVNQSLFVPQIPQVEFVYRCPGTITDPGQPFLRNLSGGTVDMFVMHKQVNFFIHHFTAANGQSLGVVAPAEGDMIRYQVAGAFGSATVDVASVHAGGVCRVQLQEVVTS
jgi:hypothetical protein